MENSYNKFTIWSIGVTFVLLQFFLQLSSGIVINKIVCQLHITALTAGLLSSAFYFVYTFMQIPVGFLFDYKSSRTVLTLSTFVMSIGCFIFSNSVELHWLFLARLLMGGGAAFSFVGMSHLLREHFPVRKFAFWLGFSETLAFLVTVLAMLNMNMLLSHFGWRGFIQITAIMSLIVSALCWLYVPDTRNKLVKNNPKKQILSIIHNKSAWINGLFAGLGFSVVTVFASLWAIPFLQLKLHCTVGQAGFQSGLFFLGAAISCPIFGFLDVHFSKRRSLMTLSCFLTASLLIIILYSPIDSINLMGGLMFLMGLSCGSYMLAYTIANEIAPKGSMSICAGFTNTIAMLSAPIFQPLIGCILDKLGTPETHTIQDYQTALLLLPTCLLIAGFLVFKLPEKEKSVLIYKDEVVGF